MIHLVSFLMPTTDPALLLYVLKVAVAALGALVGVLMALLLYIWRTNMGKMDSICSEYQNLEGCVDALDREITQLKAAALTYPDARRIFEELLTSFHESQGRMEVLLGGVVQKVEAATLKMAILEDRESRRNDLRGN